MMASQNPPSTLYKQPSVATYMLRSKVEKFMRNSHRVWKALPESDTRLVATPEVLVEVIHCATAFHCNEQGTVDLVYVKKDMPREALENAKVGYWTEMAGPAASREQLDMQRMYDIPEEDMDEIRKTNNHNLISHYLMRT